MNRATSRAPDKTQHQTPCPQPRPIHITSAHRPHEQSPQRSTNPAPRPTEPSRNNLQPPCPNPRKLPHPLDTHPRWRNDDTHRKKNSASCHGQPHTDRQRRAANFEGDQHTSSRSAEKQKSHICFSSKARPVPEEGYEAQRCSFSIACPCLPDPSQVLDI